MSQEYTLFKLVKNNLVEYRNSDVIEGVGALGIPTPANGRRMIGITISIPPGLKIPMPKPKRGTIDFGQLPPRGQYSFYLTKYIPTVITPFIHKGIIIPEFTKDKRIHCHIIAYDDDIQCDFDLITLQRQVALTTMVRKITKGKKQREIALNYIHFLNPDKKDWSKYLMKDDVKDQPGMLPWIFGVPMCDYCMYKNKMKLKEYYEKDQDPIDDDDTIHVDPIMFNVFKKVKNRLAKMKTGNEVDE